MAIGWKQARHVVAISAIAFVVTMFFFSPRYVMWTGLGVPFASVTPEASRATAVLKQVANPFFTIEEQTNVIIQWRLLLPMIGYWLHLPAGVFLSIPFIGAFVTLGYIARLLLEAGASFMNAALGTLVCATSTWFFVSTGWLSYADSWVIFGLLLIAFSPSRTALVIGCLLVPWIDERIVLAAPLAGVVRLVYFQTFREASVKSILIDLTLVTGLLVPYLGFRIYLLATHDESSTSYVQHHPQDVNTSVPLTRFLLGAWMGVRAGWIFIGLMLWICCSTTRLKRSALLIATLVVTVGLGLLVAGDIGRTSSMILPAVVCGLLLTLRQRPQFATLAFSIAAGVNLISPALHVASQWTIPILYVYSELDRFENPPTIVDPSDYVDRGTKAINDGSSGRALKFYDTALALDEANLTARVLRSMLRARTNDLNGASSDAELVVKYSPESPDGWLLRGMIFLNKNQPLNAAPCFEHALAMADPKWPHRTECAAALARIRGTK